MGIRAALLTGDSARHIGFASKLSALVDECLVISEINRQQLSRPQKSLVAQDYFSKVDHWEQLIFAHAAKENSHVQLFNIESKKLEFLPPNVKNYIEKCDLVFVFGSSIIRNDLLRLLIKKKAINVHLGISPFYRGSACNFWAIYHKDFDKVGATFHYLDKTLDNGIIIKHVVPATRLYDRFELGMRAVESAVNSIDYFINLDYLDNSSREATQLPRLIDGACFKRSDFSDFVMKKFIRTDIDPLDIREKMRCRDTKNFVNLSII